MICYICGEDTTVASAYVSKSWLMNHALDRHPNHVQCFEHLLLGKKSAVIEPWSCAPEEKLTFDDTPTEEVVYNKLQQLGHKMFMTTITKHLAPLPMLKPVSSEFLSVDHFGKYPESLITIRKIDPADLPFTLSTRFLCQHCSAYGRKRCCPPIIKTVAFYRKYVLRWSHCYLLIWQSDGRAGWHTRPDGMERKWGRTLIGIDTALTAFAYKVIENIVWSCRDKGQRTFVCLTGSCKRCKKPGCVLPPEPCRHPLPGGLSPESIGVDVMSLFHSLGIPAQLPVFDFITRMGIVFAKKEIS